jgi:hypothetical protein
MLWLGLMMAGMVMFMAMRMGADSPSPFLAAIRVRSDR